MNRFTADNEIRRVSKPNSRLVLDVHARFHTLATPAYQQKFHTAYKPKRGTHIHRRKWSEQEFRHYCRVPVPGVMKKDGKPVVTLQMGEFPDAPVGFVFASVVRDLTGILLRVPGFRPLLTLNELRSFSNDYIAHALRRIHDRITDDGGFYLKLAIEQYKRPALKTAVLDLVHKFLSLDSRVRTRAWLEITGELVPLAVVPEPTQAVSTLAISQPVVADQGKHTLVGAHGTLRPIKYDKPGPRTFLFVWSNIHVESKVVAALAQTPAAAREQVVKKYPQLAGMPLLQEEPLRIVGEGVLPLHCSFMQQLTHV